jgi:cob(I)alamin adenosyltransferase
MPKLTKIYTRAGDAGTTSLGSRQRVPKDHLRVEAYGTVDELNSQIGVAMAAGLDERLMNELAQIQNQLFDLGSDLSFLQADKEQYNIPQMEARHITALEALLDELQAIVGPLENFILPGGSLGSAQLQLARTICRRAERVTTTLAREAQEEINPYALAYLNRLSDALFVMGRYENHVRSVAEPLWQPGV